MYKILIVDNELSLVTELEKFLEENGYQLTGSAVSGHQAVEMAREDDPDLILMEIKLSGDMDGISAALKIKETKDIPVIFVTWYGDKRTLEKARRSHPAGYVLKPFRWEQITAAIALVLDDGKESDRQSTAPEKWAPGFITEAKNAPCSHPLTVMETRIANFIIAGRPVKEIACQLQVHKSTVHWHRKNIRRKIGLTGKKENLASKLAFLAPISFPFF